MKVININMKGVSNTEANNLNTAVNDMVYDSPVYKSLVKDFAEEILKTESLPSPNVYSEIFLKLHAITMSEDPLIKNEIMSAVSKMNVFSKEGRELKDEESELN